MDTVPLDFKPGDRWSYSNTGYVLLGMIIERISGQRYAEFLAQRIFKPAMLVSTEVLGPDTQAGSVARGYTWRAGRILEVPLFGLGLAKSIGSIQSTSGDLAKWIGALADGSLLRPASLEAMWSPAKLKGDKKMNSYGLGWWIGECRGHRMVSAIGGPGLGFFASVSIYPRITFQWFS